MHSTLSIGFLASRNGSGMRAIIRAIEAGELSAAPRIVVSNRGDAPALVFASEHGVATAVIPTLPDPEAADSALAAALEDAGVELVILSGYLRKLGPKTLGAYSGRVLNIHPALLPKFGGPGMYGRRVHEAVAAAGDAITGACVHIVDAEYDQGPVIASVEVPLAGGDTAQDIERKVTTVEPGLFVETLKRIAAGELRLPGGPPSP
jgi:phosphoribosylglycinamide formyltransferase-1